MPLPTADLSALSRMLDEALDLDPAQVDAWLAALPAEQAHLLPRLREMLALRLSQGHAGFMSGGPRLQDDAAADPLLARAGDLIGPYRLLREIGHGGMGAVWLAERADGSLKRRIALKLPRLVWGAGLAERMARERDIGALLEHPHIARLYDAGVDALGRPYLALEYIAGEPLDHWCEAHALGVPERLRLFLQVARAVAYAHGRLVVHRDLKPSNVLVSADGQAHLLDFGIAKLLHEAAPGDAELTQELGRVLTPHYAAPEQIRGEAITVQSDVYSLGVLLYELLTGQLPYAPQRKGLGALEEAILRDEAPLASSRTQDKARARPLRGEIDAILAKALRREPAERYATADALADDIERHLSGEPVLARPDSLGYRLGKAVWRHRFAYASAAAIMLAVLAGAGVAVVQARRANAEAERARLVKDFVLDIFSPRSGPDGSLGEMPGHALLERSAKRIGETFAGQPQLQAELYGVASDLFFGMAQEEQAATYAARQVDALIAAGADKAQTARATLRLIDFLLPLDGGESMAERARQVLDLAGDDPALLARGHAAMAQAMLFRRSDKVLAKVELDAADAAIARGGVPAVDRASVSLARGDWFGFSDSPEEARKQYDAAIALGLAAEGPQSRVAQNARQEAAKVLIFAGQFDAGRAYLAQALETMRAAGGPNDANAARWESYGADWLLGMNAIPFDEAKRTFERNLASLRTQRGSLPEEYIVRIEGHLGLAYLRWGDIEHAMPLVTRAQELLTGEAPLAQWWKRYALAHLLMRSDRAAEAPDLAREMLALQKDWQTPDDLRAGYDLLALALVHARRFAEAEAVWAEYDALPESARASGNGATQPPLTSRLLVALERGRPDAVVATTDLLAPKEGVHDDESAWLARAAALCATGRAGEGLELFDRWLPRLATDRYEASPHVAYWRARMGLCALDAGQRPRAVEAAALASAAIARQGGVSPHWKASVLELERRLKSR